MPDTMPGHPSPETTSSDPLLDEVEDYYFPRCGDQRFNLAEEEGSGLIWEVRGLVIDASVEPVREVDRLNGATWTGRLRFHYPYGRARMMAPYQQWGDWQEVHWMNPYQDVLIRRTDGKVQTKVPMGVWTDFPDRSPNHLDCGRMGARGFADTTTGRG
jgi:hypothetical protein